MGRATTVVTSELRGRLYDHAVHGAPGELYILYDRPWGCEGRLIELDPPTLVYGPPLHFLEILSDNLCRPGYNGHVDVILDAEGLRFKQDKDV